MKDLSKKVRLKTTAKSWGMRRTSFNVVFWLYFILAPAAWFAKILKLRRRNIWLFDERLSMSAQDNAFVLFQYIFKNHPDINAFFVIKAKSDFYGHFFEPNRCIRWGGLRHAWSLHWVCALISTDHLSALAPQIVSFPRLGRKSVNVFLQHGVTSNKTIRYSKNEHPYFNLVTTSNLRETDAFLEYYNYPGHQIALTGLARFDRLTQKNTNAASKTILIIPTWRRWHETQEADNKNSYAINWVSLLQTDLIKALAIEKNVKIVFCPHFRNIDLFKAELNAFEYIEMVNMVQNDISPWINSADILLTDYSGVMFDFIFQRKTVISFAFDYDEWLAHEQSKPLLDLSSELPIRFCENLDETLNAIEDTVFLEGKPQFSKALYELALQHYDHKNCKRIFEAIKKRL